MSASGSARVPVDLAPNNVLLVFSCTPPLPPPPSSTFLHHPSKDVTINAITAPPHASTHPPASRQKGKLPPHLHPRRAFCVCTPFNPAYHNHLNAVSASANIVIRDRITHRRGCFATTHTADEASAAPTTPLRQARRRACVWRRRGNHLFPLSPPDLLPCLVVLHDAAPATAPASPHPLLFGLAPPPPFLASSATHTGIR
ncbi:hypothetical protein Fmac_002095 [Flemingia macrophylla]|uniref:Uncharacterized protein n=1 Tax=Flemingia macrophylla TaxID=520843 RepID=A0ABD1NLR7_9FABA